MNMKIECKRLSISEEDLGLQIVFYSNEKEEDPESLDYSNITEVVNSIGPYLMIQRSYPEDEFEKDYYYIELTDFDESGDLKEFVFTLTGKKLKIKWEKNSVEIELNIDEKEIEDLIEALIFLPKLTESLILKSKTDGNNGVSTY